MTTLQRIIDAIITTALLSTLALHSAQSQTAAQERVGDSIARSGLRSREVETSADLSVVLVNPALSHQDHTKQLDVRPLQ